MDRSVYSSSLFFTSTCAEGCASGVVPCEYSPSVISAATYKMQTFVGDFVKVNGDIVFIVNIIEQSGSGVNCTCQIISEISNYVRLFSKSWITRVTAGLISRARRVRAEPLSPQ